MNNKQNDLLPDSMEAKTHIENLIKSGKIEYGVFNLLDLDESNTLDKSDIRKSLIEIIEINHTTQLNQGYAIYNTAQEILQMRHPHAARLFQTWIQCLTMAKSDYKTMQHVCSKFASIVPALSSPWGEKFMELAPEFVKYHKQDTFSLIPFISNRFSTLNSPEQNLTCLNFIQKYMASATDKVLRGLLKISLILSGWQDAGIFEKFEQICPPKVLIADQEAAAFMIKLGNALDHIDKKNQRTYFDLCLTAARQSFGSASFIAVSLPKKLFRLSGTAKTPYVDSFYRIVNTVGIRSVGFCSDRLFSLFLRHSPAAIQKVIDLNCEIASHYGSTAAFHYLEGNKPLNKGLRRDFISISLLMVILLIFVLFLWILLK